MRDKYNRWSSQAILLSVQSLVRMLCILTFFPHLNGVTAFPSTGSWLIAIISLFARMDNVSFVMADSFTSSIKMSAMRNPVQENSRWFPVSRSCQVSHEISTKESRTMSKGDFKNAHAVKWVFHSWISIRSWPLLSLILSDLVSHTLVSASKYH